MIRLTVPSIGDEDIQAVAAILRTGFLVQGAQVAAFEAAVAQEVGTAHAVAVSNCTVALHGALLALGVGAGDRVAVTAYSWPATANVIALCGAEPVFVDIDQTFNMNPDRLEEALLRNQVKAVLPVHAFGGMADIGRILAIAKRHGALLVEDAACALGAAWQGRKAGSWGVMGCFSFHPRKAITTGEGGVVTTDDPQLARTVRMLRNHGLDPDAPGQDFLIPGYNWRMTEFQAALGLVQMAKLERIIAARVEQAARYDALLAGTGLASPVVPAASSHVYQSYVALLPGEAAARRQGIIAGLKARGIETTIGTYHMPLITYYRTRYGYAPGDFPVTDDLAARAISLPLFETLTEELQVQVVDNLVAVVAG